MQGSACYYLRGRDSWGSLRLFLFPFLFSILDLPHEKESNILKESLHFMTSMVISFFLDKSGSIQYTRVSIRVEGDTGIHRYACTASHVASDLLHQTPQKKDWREGRKKSRGRESSLDCYAGYSTYPFI